MAWNVDDELEKWQKDFDARRRLDPTLSHTAELRAAKEAGLFKPPAATQAPTQAPVTGMGVTGTPAATTQPSMPTATTVPSMPLQTAPPLTPPPAVKPYSTDLPAFDPSKNPFVQQDQSITNRLNTMTQQNTPLMQQARTQGMQIAARRGLANSSMAVGETQKAAYNAALPVAQTEAGWAAQANLTDQQNTNTALMNAYNAALNRGGAELTSQRAAETEAQKNYFDLIKQGYSDRAAMERLVQTGAQDMERQQVVTQAGLQTNYVTAAANLEAERVRQNSAIIQSQTMTAAAKEAAIIANNNWTASAQAALASARNVGGKFTWSVPAGAPPKPAAADLTTDQGADGTWYGKKWDGSAYTRSVIPAKPADRTEGGKIYRSTWDPASGQWIEKAVGNVPTAASTAQQASPGGGIFGQIIPAIVGAIKY